MTLAHYEADQLLVTMRWLKFSEMAKQFDGMHLTDNGQWATRLPPFDSPNLYGWDCESTLWFRWAFDKVEDGGLVVVGNELEEVKE